MFCGFGMLSCTYNLSSCSVVYIPVCVDVILLTLLEDVLYTLSTFHRSSVLTVFNPFCLISLERLCDPLVILRERRRCVCLLIFICTFKLAENEFRKCFSKQSFCQQTQTLCCMLNHVGVASICGLFLVHRNCAEQE